MTYYKYAERDATNQIDWNKISTSIVKDMAAISEAKAKRREADQSALNDSLQRMMEKPIGEDLAENQRIANFTQQAEELLLGDLRALKRGNISRREYNLKYNNLKQGTESAFSLSQQYQDAYQIHVDRMNAGIASGGEPKLLAKAEQYGLAKDSQYYINPLTNGVNLALTTGEGEEGDITIGDSSFDLMGMSAARNMIFQKIDKYQTQDQVKKLTDNLKTEALDVLDGVAPDGKSLRGYISTTKGFDVEALFDITEEGLVPKKGNEAAANALLSQINATFAGDPYARYSFLEDTIGTINGKTIDFVFANKNETPEQFLNRKTEDHEVKMVLDKQDRYVPQITESQKNRIDRTMVALIKNSIDTSFGIKADRRSTFKQIFDMNKINSDIQDNKDSMELRLSLMGQLYRGDAVDLSVATEFFKNMDADVVKVERDDNGIIITTQQEGEAAVPRRIEFYATNAKGEKVPKTEQDFITAASNLLLGEEETKKKEFLQILRAKDSDGNSVFGKKNPTKGKVTVGQGGSATGRTTYNISTNKYLDGKIESDELDFGGGNFQDQDLAKALETQFLDLGLKAEATGGAINEVFITIPGLEERVIIDANNLTPSGQRKEKQKLRKFLLGAIKKLGIEQKLNLEADPQRGRASQY